MTTPSLPDRDEAVSNAARDLLLTRYRAAQFDATRRVSTAGFLCSPGAPGSGKVRVCHRTRFPSVLNGLTFADAAAEEYVLVSAYADLLRANGWSVRERQGRSALLVSTPACPECSGPPSRCRSKPGRFGAARADAVRAVPATRTTTSTCRRTPRPAPTAPWSPTTATARRTSKDRRMGLAGRPGRRRGREPARRVLGAAPYGRRLRRPRREGAVTEPSAPTGRSTPEVPASAREPGDGPPCGSPGVSAADGPPRLDGAQKYAEVAHRIYRDRRATPSAKELLLAVAYALFVAPGVEKGRVLNRAAQVLGRDAVGHPRYDRLIADDAPRYEPPRTADDCGPSEAPACEAPRLRPYTYRPRPAAPADEAVVPLRRPPAPVVHAYPGYVPPIDYRNERKICGADSHHRVLELDPRTGTASGTPTTPSGSPNNCANRTPPHPRRSPTPAASSPPTSRPRGRTSTAATPRPPGHRRLTACRPTTGPTRATRRRHAPAAYGPGELQHHPRASHPRPKDPTARSPRRGRTPSPTDPTTQEPP